MNNKKRQKKNFHEIKLAQTRCQNQSMSKKTTAYNKSVMEMGDVFRFSQNISTMAFVLLHHRYLLNELLTSTVKTNWL
jgi:hypothetical protein